MMDRRKLLIRQRGTRHLGDDEEVHIPAGAGADADADDDDAMLLHLPSMSQLMDDNNSSNTKSLRRKHSSSSTRSHHSVNNNLARLSFISEHDRYPQKNHNNLISYYTDANNGNDCSSVCSNSTGIPSLASINPGSVGTGSYYSRSQGSVSGRASRTSSSSYHDVEDSVSVASSLVSELTLRSKMRVLLRKGIDENCYAADTLDCLEPVVALKTEAAMRRQTEQSKWGSSSPPTSQHSCRSEITVCRASYSGDGDESSDNTDCDDFGTISSHSPVCVQDIRGSSNHSSSRNRQQHRLSSRNADAAPSLPPSRQMRERLTGDTVPAMPMSRGVIMMRDKIPGVPRRRSTEDALVHNHSYHPPPSIKDLVDHVPAPPRRRGSNGRRLSLV